ncbi:MAG: YcbK family protein [Bdellovibrionota bacterium]
MAVQEATTPPSQDISLILKLNKFILVGILMALAQSPRSRDALAAGQPQAKEGANDQDNAELDPVITGPTPDRRTGDDIPPPPPSQLTFGCDKGDKVIMSARQNVSWGSRSGTPSTEVIYAAPDVTGKPVRLPVQSPGSKPCNVQDDPNLLKLVRNVACNVGGDFVLVHSAYRTPNKNQAVGGKTKSFHMRCKALDFTVRKSGKGVAPYTVQVSSFMIGPSYGMGGEGLYQNFTHVDVGPVRHWFGPGFRPSNTMYSK